MYNNKKKDIIRTFKNFSPRENVGLTNRVNIITGRQVPQPRTASGLYFTADIVESFALHKNAKVQNTQSKFLNNFVAQDNKYPYMKKVNIEEIYAFIGLYLYCVLVLYKLNTLSVHNIFFDGFCPPIFSATMSRNRFAFILANFPLIMKQYEKTDGNIIALWT